MISSQCKGIIQGSVQKVFQDYTLYILCKAEFFEEGRSIFKFTLPGFLISASSTALHRTADVKKVESKLKITVFFK